MQLPHHPNSTHDEVCNDVVDQDMYWDDDSDKPYEAYMDHWCSMVFPEGDAPLLALLCPDFGQHASANLLSDLS